MGQDDAIADPQWANWIQTTSGRRFYVVNPGPDDYAIDDIARGQSRIARWCGQGRVTYRLGQHSCEVERVVQILAIVRCYSPSEILMVRKAAMLHDALEPLGFGDPASPVKRRCRDFGALEDAGLQTLFGHFGLPWPMPPVVREVDRAMIVKEWQLLFGEDVPLEYGPDPEPNRRLVAWSEAECYRNWLDKWCELAGLSA